MRKASYIVLVFIICLSVLLALYRLYRTGYENFYSFENGRLEEIINGKENYDALFIGSSRTYYHINPKVVDSVAQMSSYNAGMDGANLLETNFILQSYLSSHKPPKVVVVDIAENAFSIKRPFFNPSLYYPFLENPVVFNALRPYEHVYLLKYFPFFRFIEADDLSKQNSILGHFEKTSFDSSEFYKGHLKSGNRIISLPFVRMYANVSYDIEKEGLEYLEQIISTCKKKNIKLVLTFAPLYDAKNNVINPQFFSTINSVSIKKNVPFWDYSNIPICNNNELFRDEEHLNNKGADIYSEIIAKDLKKLLTGGSQEQ